MTKEIEEMKLAIANGLPDVCAVLHPTDNVPVLIRRGEPGYEPFTSKVNVDDFNAALKITPPQREAMLAGSMFRWDAPAADPANYHPDGTPVRKGEKRKQPYAVTLEWASTISYVVVPVEASSVEEAIGLAFENLRRGWRDLRRPRRRARHHGGCRGRHFA
jgi:hypothetical protein